MKTVNISFNSADGKTRIHGVKWTREDKNYVGVLHIIHGMIDHISRYEELAEYFSDRGFLVVGFDMLGHGASAADDGQYGYFTEHDPAKVLIRDIYTMYINIHKEYPDLNYFMLGHSMGSYLLRMYICRHPDTIDGAIFMGAGYISPEVCTFGQTLCGGMAKIYGTHHRSHLMEAMIFSGPYRKFDMLGKDFDNSWLCKDHDRLKIHYADPLSTFTFTLNGFYGLMQVVKYTCSEKNLALLPKDLPMLFVSGDEDPVGDLGRGVKKVYDMYSGSGAEDISMKLFKGDRHELFNETDRADVFDYMYKWVNDRNL
ncbi:MAG: alpha/beta fold hydrolase [Lachnospiraceae bacterium]|nr:alpha/beta fold hydrolase [Lachnospiraceae bacterium]